MSSGNTGIKLTPQAAKRLRELQMANPGKTVRLSVQNSGSSGMQYRFDLVDNSQIQDDDVKLTSDAEGNQLSTRDVRLTKDSGESKDEESTQTVKNEPILESDQPHISAGTTISLIPTVIPVMQSASSTSTGVLARKPYIESNFSSSGSSSPGTRARPIIQIGNRPTPTSIFEPDLTDVEIMFLRVVGRLKIPIADRQDIQLDSIDRRLDAVSRHGATMQVHKGKWKGQRAAFKFIKRSTFSDGSETSESEAVYAYKRDMFDLNFELQIMSKASLRAHPNITRLLGVYFDVPEESLDAFAEPGLIVELAHEQYPDLASYFDDSSNPDRSPRLPYATAASLIADIADGVQVLHDHDLVHADLKPGNILLFPNDASPCGLTAKIADFGFTGMTTYNIHGQRAPLPTGRPRGGTPEWNAPECFTIDDPSKLYRHLDHYPQYNRNRDIYSFGLVASFIALDGQPPREYIENLTEAKLSDKMIDAVVLQIEKHYLEKTREEKSLKDVAIYIARNTLNLDHKARTKLLRPLKLREMLFSDTTTPTQWRTEFFVLDFELFPQTAQELRRSGLYDAFWACPLYFREKVRESFRNLGRGERGLPGQYIEWEIMRLLSESSV